MCARGLRGLVWDQDNREFESHHPDKNNNLTLRNHRGFSFMKPWILLGVS